MNLIIEKPKSKKVKEVQSRFDVGDFKKAEKSENNSDEDYTSLDILDLVED